MCVSVFGWNKENNQSSHGSFIIAIEEKNTTPPPPRKKSQILFNISGSGVEGGVGLKFNIQLAGWCYLHVSLLWTRVQLLCTYVCLSGSCTASGGALQCLSMKVSFENVVRRIRGEVCMFASVFVCFSFQNVFPMHSMFCPILCPHTHTHTHLARIYTHTHTHILHTYTKGVLAFIVD